MPETAAIWRTRARLDVGVELDLVDDRLDLGRLQQVFDVHPPEIGDANGAGFARAVDGLNEPPRLGDSGFVVRAVLVGVWGMEQKPGKSSAMRCVSATC